MKDDRIDILGCTSAQFVDYAARSGVHRHNALGLYQQFFREQCLDLDVPDIQTPDVQVAYSVREGETVKFIQTDGAGREIESVIIPGVSKSGRRRATLCVSSQIGCAMGCEFCETAQMGLIANLSAAQIVVQWFAARFELGYTIDNIVFMGMGEPLDNIHAVLQAIRVLTDHHGPSIAPSRITVSTVGRTRGITTIAELRRAGTLGPVRLAVSINAPNDSIRGRIMPINRAEPMDALMEAMNQWPDRVLIEYVLIPGVNDVPDHADALSEYLQPLDCTVNVIPYNPRRDSPWPAPNERNVQRFVDRLVERGVMVRRRQTKGRHVMAACGQLGNPDIRRKRSTPLTTHGGAAIA